MSPYLRHGDYVLAVRPWLKPPRVNDTVIFWAIRVDVKERWTGFTYEPEIEARIIWIAHQVIWKNETHVITKGLANPKPDFDGKPFPKERIKWVVIAVYRHR